MSATVQRSLLTNALLVLLRAVELPGGEQMACGDMEIPDGVGWSGLGPNAPGSYFAPYWIMTPLLAAPTADSGGFAAPQADWHFPYSLQSYNADREGAEYLGDLARDTLAPLLHQVLDLGDAHYRVQQVWTDSIGGVQRVPGTDPAYFGQNDQFTVWVTKQRSA